MRIRNGLTGLTSHAPFLRLIEGGGGDEGGGGGGNEGGKTDEGGDKGKGGQQQPDTGKTFSSDDVSRIVEERLGERDRKHARELEQAKSDAGKNETQRIEAERDRAVERAEAAAQKAAPKVANALAQVAAITAGGRADRAAAIVRMADLDGVTKFDGDDWSVDETKLASALDKVKSDYPEWFAEAGNEGGDEGKGKGDDEGKGKGGKSGGDLGGGGGGGEVTLEAFQRMGMGARSELKQSDPEAYRRLADAEIDAKANPSRR